MRIGSPITGYGQESRNRAARQRIPNRVWTDEEGVEHVEVGVFTCIHVYFPNQHFRRILLNTSSPLGFKVFQ